MSFDDSNVMIRSEEETKRLKEERRKRMFGGAPSPSPISTDVSTVDTSFLCLKITFYVTFIFTMCPPWTHCGIKQINVDQNLLNILTCPPWTHFKYH